MKSAYASPAVYVYSITPELYINRIENNTMRVPAQIRVANGWKTADAMIDSGAMGRFIEPAIVEKLRLQRKALDRPIRVWNVDGTINRNGSITHAVDWQFNVE